MIIERNPVDAGIVNNGAGREVRRLGRLGSVSLVSGLSGLSCRKGTPSRRLHAYLLRATWRCLAIAGRWVLGLSPSTAVGLRILIF
jgi:hypothetical protein